MDITAEIQIAQQRYKEANGKPCTIIVAKGEVGTPLTKIRPLRLFKDDGGLYVRLGQQGAEKQYLHSMRAARTLHMTTLIPVFYEN